LASTGSLREDEKAIFNKREEREGSKKEIGGKEVFRAAPRHAHVKG